MSSHDIKASNILCLYAHYNKNQSISSYVYTYLLALKNCGCRVNIISNSEIDEKSRTCLLEKIPGCGIYVRENKGFDFGGWAWFINNYSIPEGIEYILFTNDSVFGPLFDLAKVFEKMMNKADLDFWGMTDSFQGGWHIQSYFICISKKAFTSKAFKQFFSQKFDAKNKDEVVKSGEILLSKTLAEHGFKGEAYISYKNFDKNFDSASAVNPTHFFWNTLINKFNYPFIKKDLLLKNPENIQNLDQAFNLIRQVSSYDIENIKSFLTDEAYENSQDLLSVGKSITVVCHIYYPHSIWFFLLKLSVLKTVNTKFYFNLSTAIGNDPDCIDVITNTFKKSVILIAPDKGRDIGGKLAALDVLLKTDNFSLCTLIIHDKFSPHSPTGTQWRDKLFRIMDVGMIEYIISEFENKLNIGAIAAKEFIKNEYNPDTGAFDCTSSDIIKESINTYELKLKDFSYVAGTIFWIRTSVLKDFFLKFPPLLIREGLEDGNALDFTQGTRVHTWERLFSLLAGAQNLKIAGV